MTDFNPQDAVLKLSRVMTYQEIAKRCDTGKGNVAHWAAGQHNPNGHRWQLLLALWEEFRICQAANVEECKRVPVITSSACVGVK